MYAPIKIDLIGNTIGGHRGAIPVGTIIEVRETEEHIIGTAVIWAEEFPEVSTLLIKRTAENNPVATSWEILYAQSETDTDGIEWLHGTVYAANTIIRNPSYGNMTLLRAIAEDITGKESMDKTEAENLEEDRQEISNLMSMLNTIYATLDELWCKTFEIEEAQVLEQTSDVTSFTSRLNALISNLTSKANEVGMTLQENETETAELRTSLETANAELSTFRAEKALAEKTAAENKRKWALAEIGISTDDTNLSSYLSLTDDQFNLFVVALKTVNRASAETKNIRLPEPTGSQEVTTVDIIEAHKEYTKKR